MDFGWLYINVGNLSVVTHIWPWWRILITGDAMHVSGQEVYGKLPYFPLNFSVKTISLCIFTIIPYILHLHINYFCINFYNNFLKILFNNIFNCLKFFWTIKVLLIDPSLGKELFFNSKLSTIRLCSDKFVVRILHFSVFKLIPWAVNNNQFQCVIYLL